MPLRRIATALAVGALALGVAARQPAQAAVSFHANDLAGFLAAAGGPVSLESFDDAILNPGLSITGGSVVIRNGRLNDRIDDGRNTASTVFSFATPINAFGAMFNMSPGGPGTGIAVRIDLLSGGLTALTQEIPNTFTGQFWGLTSTVAFDEVRFYEGTQGKGSERYRLDELRYATTATAIAEPASLALLASGLLALGAVRRLRRPAG